MRIRTTSKWPILDVQYNGVQFSLSRALASVRISTLIEEEASDIDISPFSLLLVVSHALVTPVRSSLVSIAMLSSCCIRLITNRFVTASPHQPHLVKVPGHVRLGSSNQSLPIAS